MYAEHASRPPGELLRTYRSRTPSSPSLVITRPSGSTATASHPALVAAELDRVGGWAPPGPNTRTPPPRSPPPVTTRPSGSTATAVTPALVAAELDRVGAGVCRVPHPHPAAAEAGAAAGHPAVRQHRHRTTVTGS